MVIHLTTSELSLDLMFQDLGWSVAIQDQGKTSGKVCSWLSKAANTCHYWRRYVREVWILTQSISVSCKGLST